MSQAQVDRVSEDLAAMRRVLGFRVPFEREHVWANLALAVAGLTVAVVTEWTNISSVPAVPGSGAHWAYIGLVTVPALLVLAMLAAMAHRRKDAASLLWRESRRAWVAAAIAVPVYLGFTAWAVSRGASAGMLSSSTLFLAGLFSFLGAIADRGMRHALGWAVSTMIAGVVAPSAIYESAGLLVGGWLLAGGLSSAAVMAWQLKTGSEHGAD
jgi:hypothetical protein